MALFKLLTGGSPAVSDATNDKIRDTIGDHDADGNDVIEYGNPISSSVSTI